MNDYPKLELDFFYLRLWASATQLLFLAGYGAGIEFGVELHGPSLPVPPMKPKVQ